jgi:hypothetical protein
MMLDAKGLMEADEFDEVVASMASAHQSAS